MSRTLDRRIAALEAGSRPDEKDSPWLDILREVPFPALVALETFLMTNPSGEEEEVGCLKILKDFAPDDATLERWLQALGAP